MHNSKPQVYKALLAPGHARLHACDKAWMNDCDRDGMACKTESIYYLALYKKSLPTPARHGKRCFSISPAKSSTPS